MYLLVPLHASRSVGALALQVESERAALPTVASISPDTGPGVMLHPRLTVHPASVSLPAANHRFHVEFLERAQRELTPLVPHARESYRQRQLERRNP